MKSRVLDSSVVLAVLFEEPGYEDAALLAEGGVLSVVNVAEIFAKCVDRGVPQASAIDYVAAAGIEIADFDLPQAQISAALRDIAGGRALSLGDRACLALAIDRAGTAVTGDRIWSTFDLPCDVALFR